MERRLLIELLAGWVAEYAAINYRSKGWRFTRCRRYIKKMASHRRTAPSCSGASGREKA